MGESKKSNDIAKLKKLEEEMELADKRRRRSIQEKADSARKSNLKAEDLYHKVETKMLKHLEVAEASVAAIQQKFEECAQRHEQVLRDMLENRKGIYRPKKPNGDEESKNAEKLLQLEEKLEKAEQMHRAQVNNTANAAHRQNMHTEMVHQKYEAQMQQNFKDSEVQLIKLKNEIDQASNRHEIMLKEMLENRRSQHHKEFVAPTHTDEEKREKLEQLQDGLEHAEKLKLHQLELKQDRARKNNEHVRKVHHDYEMKIEQIVIESKERIDQMRKSLECAEKRHNKRLAEMLNNRQGQHFEEVTHLVEGKIASN